MFNFLPLVMNALQGQKAQKENANQNEARAYMGQAPVQGERVDFLQGVISPGGHKEPDGDEDAQGNEPPGPEEGGPSQIDLGSAKYNNPAMENRPGPAGMTQMTKGTGSFLDDTFGTNADDDELL